ncbi:MAG: hypothetical protein ACM31E_09045 [Fibrobacterota bacterium]
MGLKLVRVTPAGKVKTIATAPKKTSTGRRSKTKVEKAVVSKEHKEPLKKEKVKRDEEAKLVLPLGTKSKREKELLEILNDNLFGNYNKISVKDFENIAKKILNRPLPEKMYQDYKSELEEIIDTWNDLQGKIDEFTNWNPEKIKWDEPV